MPTSRDLKSGDSLFFHNPPPPPLLAGNSMNPIHDKYGNDLGHYMKSYIKFILSKFAIIILMPEIIFFVRD